MSEEKYIAKNKDTGEVFDIRDLANLPVESYTIFPNELAIPQDEDEVRRAHHLVTSQTQVAILTTLCGLTGEANQEAAAIADKD